MFKHAHLIVQYAQDALEHNEPWKLWEYNVESTWYPCESHPTWAENNEYRRKIDTNDTIVIGDVEVPAPITTPLNVGEYYYLVYLTTEKGFDKNRWTNDELDYRWLRDGLIHKSADAARTHAQALLAFTKKDGEVKAPVKTRVEFGDYFS